MMRRRRPLMRQGGGTTQGSRFNAPMIGNVSEAGRSSLSGMSMQDLLARLEAPTVPDRYADGGRRILIRLIVGRGTFSAG